MAMIESEFAMAFCCPPSAMPGPARIPVHGFGLCLGRFEHGDWVPSQLSHGDRPAIANHDRLMQTKRQPWGEGAL